MVWLGISELSILNSGHYTVSPGVLLGWFPIVRNDPVRTGIAQPLVAAFVYLHELLHPCQVRSVIVGTRLPVKDVAASSLLTHDECQRLFRTLSFVNVPKQFSGLEPFYGNAMGNGRFWPSLRQ